MDKKMKLLIAYDGSGSADTALDDLQWAGLPAETEAIVISVADIFMPCVGTSKSDRLKSAMVSHGSSAVDRRVEQVSRAFHEGCQWAAKASERLHAQFPTWNVQTEVRAQSPAWAIVEKADEWNPNLIVLGSHNRSALGRLFLGSISQTVVTEARCPVRIARSRLARDRSPVQVLVAVDGSPGAALAVAEVANRAWPPDTRAHLIAVIDRAMLTASEWTDQGFKDEKAWIERIFATATEKLCACGLDVSEIVKEGDPREVLVEEADRLRSDCIFLGAKGLRRRKRFLLGSVSTAVVTRAQCSVEVVRHRESTEQEGRKGA